MKIAHIADVHWRGLSRHDEYKHSFLDFFNKLNILNPDIIYVGGDIVHSKTQGISPELIDSLCWWFNSLSEIAPVHVILGNHDGLQYNKDRQDAISPIISALDNDNIYLYKNSGTYPTGIPGFNWCVFSCFDEGNWGSVCPVQGEINIALFHGGVLGSVTDIDWMIDGEIPISFFDDYDFALLGDIHKCQFLNDNKTIGYCGSSIQQNYGEDVGKGFLFWDIKSKSEFTSEFHEIFHNKPFITIDWLGNVSDTIKSSLQYPDGSRFRIRSQNLINQANGKQLQFDLKRLKSATEVVFKSDSTFDASKIQAGDGTFKKEDLRDSSIQKRLIHEYYESLDLDENMLDSLDLLIEKYISQISNHDDVLRNTRWTINKIKFDNLFSYGNKNVINFDKLPGITGIFGKNTKGKSSIIGALMYGLYNTTDRGSIKNLHLINNRKNACKSEIDISVNGDPFRISRSTVKHQTKKGEIYASTSLSFHKLNSEGDEVEDLKEEQRRETEKILRKMIGTSEDFLMTSLASQGEMNTFIRERATSRKLILSKFLDLFIFEKLYELAKNDSSDLKNKAKLFPSIDWDSKIDDIKFDILKNIENSQDVDSKIQLHRERLDRLKIELAMSSDPHLVTQQEINIEIRKVDCLEVELSDIQRSEKTIKNRIYRRKKRLKDIEIILSSLSIEKLREKINIQRDLEKRLINLKNEYENQKQILDRQIDSINKLKDVPCGDSFPSCMFIKDSHMDKQLIKSQRESVEKSMMSLNDAHLLFERILKEELSSKIEEYNRLSENHSSIIISLSSDKIQINDSINNKKDASSRVQQLKDKIEDMRARVSTCSDSNEIKIKNNILSIDLEIEKLDKERILLAESVSTLKGELSRVESERSEFNLIEGELRIYDLFLQAMSKKGIPLQIMSSQLPIINSEIEKILQGVVGFTVELEADQESNAMDVFINYGDSRRVIELASGMEKMMSSLAIRVALINVSSLTKTNMLIIDEGFGALDETNIEACSRLLKSLKKWFKNIIVISHVDAIKDCVDNSLDILKKEKDSFIRHE